MELNEELIRKAQLKATGANIHKINEAICNYRAYISWINGTAWWGKYPLSEKHMNTLTKLALDWQKYLAQLIDENVTMEKPKVFI